MKSTIYYMVLLVIGLLFTAFSPANTACEQELCEWHKKHIENLKQESGWLDRADLFWLHEGVNTFGSDPENEILFSRRKASLFWAGLCWIKAK